MSEEFLVFNVEVKGHSTEKRDPGPRSDSVSFGAGEYVSKGVPHFCRFILFLGDGKASSWPTPYLSEQEKKRLRGSSLRSLHD